MENFVIFCTARTGSYRLVDVLNRQENIVCHGEVFKEKRIELDSKYLKTLQLSPEDFEKRDKHPIKFYNKLIGIDNGKIVGLKIFPEHNQKIYSYLAKNPTIKTIFLARNPIQSFISLTCARKTGLWVLKDKKEENNTQVLFNEDHFFQHFTERFSTYVNVKILTCRSNKDLYKIDYSQTFSTEELTKLSQFIGIPYTNTASDHKKIITKDYAEIVENWDDVEKLMNHFKVNTEMNFFEFSEIMTAALNT